MACGTTPFGNWAGRTLTLTIRSDTALSNVMPPPDSLASGTYSWHSPRGACGKLPHVSVSVPTGLPGYLSAILTEPRTPIEEALGWAGLVLLMLSALWLALRIPQTASGRTTMLGLIVLAMLGIVPGVIDLNFSYSPRPLRDLAEIVACYGVLLALVLSLWAGRSMAVRRAARPGSGKPSRQQGTRDPTAPQVAVGNASRWPPRRAVPVTLAVTVPAAAVLLGGAFRYRVWFAGAADLLTATAAVLLVAVGVVLCGIARAVPVTDESIVTGPAWATLSKVRDFTVFWAGSALLVALAFSMGNVVAFAPGTAAATSELLALRYPLAPFGRALIAVALVIPLAYAGRRAGKKLVAAAVFGWSIATQQPDLSVGGVVLPVGTALLAVLVYVLVQNKGKEHELPSCDDSGLASSRLRTCTPHEDAAANTALAVKIAAVLAIVPVSYFLYSALTSLPSTLQQPGPGLEFGVGGLLSQLAGWLVIGVVFSVLSSRLPGSVGPVRAVILTAAWFTAATAVHIANGWIQYSTGRAWLFPGLQLLLFLVAFSVIWDACILKRGTWTDTIKDLRDRYKLKETRTIVVYAIPVLLTLIAIGQQLASGSGTDFVKSVLNEAATIFGARP